MSLQRLVTGVMTVLVTPRSNPNGMAESPRPEARMGTREGPTQAR